jgi:hypothetical protein
MIIDSKLCGNLLNIIASKIDATFGFLDLIKKLTQVKIYYDHSEQFYTG